MKTPSENDYAGYAWIKVPRYEDDPNLSWPERYERLEKHHIQETTFLIEEVRTLARLLDQLQKHLRNE